MTIPSPLISTSPTPTSLDTPDLDTPDELSVRSLLLGIAHRNANEFRASRLFLEDALQRHESTKINTWVGGLSCYELAVLDLKEADALYGRGSLSDASAPPLSTDAREAWKRVLKDASEKLDKAMSLSGQSIDMSSRLDMRVSMLRDELATKREMVET